MAIKIIKVVIKDSELNEQIADAYVLYKLRKAGIPLDRYNELHGGNLMKCHSPELHETSFVWSGEEHDD